MREPFWKRMGMAEPRHFQSSMLVDRELWKLLKRNGKWAYKMPWEIVAILVYRWLRERGEFEYDSIWETASQSLEAKIERGYWSAISTGEAKEDKAYADLLTELAEKYEKGTGK